MYAPHTVTLYNLFSDGERLVTVLDGVFLDTRQGGRLMKNGLESDDNAVLYIPFACEAVDALSGLPQRFCPPKEFDRLCVRDGLWTIGPRDARSGVDCFFVNGKVIEPDAGFAELNDLYDAVFRVSSVDTRDFGSPNMRHWKIGGL